MDFDHLQESNKRPYAINNKIMVTALLCLTFVILFVILLHIYARCVLRHPRHNRTATATAFIINQTVAPQGAQQTTKSAGLDQTTINFIPSLPLKQTNGPEHIECAVCLSMLEAEELARRLPNCNHVFHMECIDMWLSGRPTCPICRADATPRLVPLEREPPMAMAMGSDKLVSEVVVVTTSQGQSDHDVVNSRKINNGAELSSSSSFRISSFRNMIIGRDRSSSSSSSSSNRIQVCEENVIHQV